MEYWTDSYGRLELQLSLDQAAQGYHRGACDADIAALMQDQTISSQLSKLDPEIVRDCLKEYGAWDQEELSNHNANLERLLWIACGDIQEREI
mgnify:FL=1